MFDQSATIQCADFVYERYNSVVYDVSLNLDDNFAINMKSYHLGYKIMFQFNLGCQEWYRALAGTLQSLGTLLVLPITGYVSDRWGRRVALCISIFNLALIGLIRAFSVNYPMYLSLQLLQTTLGAGTFSSAYVFGAFYFY